MPSQSKIGSILLRYKKWHEIITLTSFHFLKPGLIRPFLMLEFTLMEIRSSGSIVHEQKAKSKGGGVCAYVKMTLKAKVVKEFSGISESGVHQLWLLVQHRKLKSLLVCIAYRPPDTPISFLNDDLMPAYTQALLLDKDIILTGDLNCDVLPENHNSEGRTLLSFFTDVNATQLIDKPTRVTATTKNTNWYHHSFKSRSCENEWCPGTNH